MKKVYILLCFVIILALSKANAQGINSSPGMSRFMLRGYSDATFKSSDGESSFGNARFIPVFLYQQSDKLFFEGELEFAYDEGELEAAIEYANMYYSLRPNLHVRAGKILVPFGIFFDRLHPSWINRLPTNPLGYGHDGILPSADIGVELRGASYLGRMKYNFSIYATNGPRLKDGEDEPEEIGMIMYDPMEDNNNNKATGGRLGLFPFKDQSLELGFSAQTAKLGNRESSYEDVSALLYAFDWTYVKMVSFLGGVVDVKGQLNFIELSDQEYEVEIDSVLENFNFSNQSKSSFFQLSYRPTLGNSQFVKNLELVGRYSTLMTPEGAPWESESNQVTVGLNYWIDWRTAIKLAYQTDNVSGGHDTGGAELGKVTTESFFIQWTLGF